MVTACSQRFGQGTVARQAPWAVQEEQVRGERQAHAPTLTAVVSYVKIQSLKEV
jgi:hypothetical protein